MVQRVRNLIRLHAKLTYDLSMNLSLLLQRMKQLLLLQALLPLQHPLLYYLVFLFCQHIFVFYFGIGADITPPVALAAFAVSGISGGKPMRTGVNAAKLAIATFTGRIFACLSRKFFPLIKGYSKFGHDVRNYAKQSYQAFQGEM